MATAFIAYLIVYALVGAAVGSFLNVVADRVPAKESLIRPPSRCPGCGRPLGPLEMVPIVSYLALRGRCRTCDSHIPQRVLWTELGTALAFAALFFVYGPSLRLVLTSVWTAVLIAILVIDLEHRIVPNVIVLPAAVLALLTIPVQGLLTRAPFGHYAFLSLFWGGGSLTNDQLGMLSQLLGGVISFAMFFVVWIITPNGMGEGDVKLSLFTGLVTAIPGAVLSVAASWVLGGIVAAFLLIARRGGRKSAIPFAPFLAASAFGMLLLSDFIVYRYVSFLIG